MTRVGTVLTLAVLCAAVGGAAQGQQVTGSHHKPSASYNGHRAPAFMKIFGPAQPPYGFVRFCESNPKYCAPHGIAETRLTATPERLIELDEVNRYVNDRIQPLTDQEIYGVTEYWTLPDKYGDCEDYVLLKRQILIERGWPPSALLITVVRDEYGDGHAVLTARTSQGDYILDNKVSEVRVWSSTPYQYVMRQSYVNPRVWVSLEEMLVDQPLVMSGNSGSDRD
ncbi:Transglutaminase [Candidatus Filomicrobium marinum]|uniref:Transglutaminase n=1 Tax=Candidatus Filomicrobium marinum TaxID=1608628 RepID=A0A0D6JI88_9HYPH|nr:transglutaminase-like cysteine peptidase [Candidatus Filomicrobium marinum]CFX38502.1 Transglutaminase [Candidatus Filomicrobium marinum]CPR21505.1 Transglutaminase [Candidatus Filomicrobium marinum]